MRVRISSQVLFVRGIVCILLSAIRQKNHNHWSAKRPFQFSVPIVWPIGSNALLAGDMMEELYTIAWAKADNKTPDVLIPPMDTNNHPDEGMMVYRSFEAAKASAEYQTEWYNDGEDQIAVPVPLKDALSLRTTRECRESNRRLIGEICENIGFDAS